MVVMLVGVSILVFTVMELAPGGPEAIYVMETMDLQAMEEVRRALGLDEPAHIRYVKWFTAAVRGDFGRSLTSGAVPVAELIAERLGPTLTLAGTGLFLAVLISVVLGVATAVYQYSWLDRIVTIYAYFGMSFPAYWLGIMFIWLFAIRLGWLPGSGMSEFGLETNILSRLSHLTLPALTLAAIWIGILTRFLRAGVLEVLQRDFVRTARSKGLSGRVIVFKHVLRNALIPFITVVGFEVPNLVAGSVFVESVFAWPGLGRLMITSIYRRDYPIVLGVCLVVSLAVILTNLIVDLAYAAIDPRIRYA